MGYKEKLNQKIQDVCSKIGFDDSNITWVIYNPKSKSKDKLLNNIFIGINGKDYGYSILQYNEIWISILSITSKYSMLIEDRIAEILKLNNEKGKDFLANVILDEVTHIQTKCDHGDNQYDEKLKENYKLYYYNIVERVLLNKN